MRNISIKFIVCLIMLLFITVTFSSATNHQCIEETKKSIETGQLQYEYYNYQDMTDLFYNLEETYPEIMSYTSLGETYEGRNIWMVKLSDNVGENEEEPGVLFMGAHHGNEKPSYESLIFFIRHIVENYGKENTDDDADGLLNEDIIDGVDNDNDGLIDEDPSEERVREVIDSTEIFVIPMVNPDGVEANTRKNRAPKEGQTGNIGVDLNRNYAFKWELYNIFPGVYNNARTSNPDGWNYRGEYPFSEKESIAVRDFVETEDIKVSISYHSFGEFISYPWTHTTKRTHHENQFISIGDGISSINGFHFFKSRGTILPWPRGIIGTSENWLYGVQDVLSFLIELCKTRVPTDPVVVHEYCLTHVGVNLYVCERAPSIKLIKNVVDRSYPFLHVLSFLQNLN